MLTGTWATGDITCEQMNAALARGGFTQAQLDAAGWDPTWCSIRPRNSRFAFSGAGSSSSKGAAWDGMGGIRSSTTTRSSPVTPERCTSRINSRSQADQLTIDVISDDFPGGDPTMSDLIAQTAIYESVPFVRQP